MAAAISKMQSALSEYGITASLLLTICFPYLFDEPDAIKAMESSSPGRICFNICIWAAVTCFCLTNLLMICVADKYEHVDSRVRLSGFSSPFFDDSPDPHGINADRDVVPGYCGWNF